MRDSISGAVAGVRLGRLRPVLDDLARLEGEHVFVHKGALQRPLDMQDPLVSLGQRGRGQVVVFAGVCNEQKAVRVLVCIRDAMRSVGVNVR